MLFKKKEYICIPLSSMHVYGENPKDIISQVSQNNSLLSDGTKIKLFFEYTPDTGKNIFELPPVKEIITGTKYKQSRGIKLTPPSIYSEKTKTSCFDYNLTTFDPINHKLLKQYLKELKEKNLYKEYIEKINQFYETSIKISHHKEDIVGPTR